MAVLVIIMGKGIKTMCMLCVAIYVLLQTGRVSSAPKACPGPEPAISANKNVNTIHTDPTQSTPAFPVKSTESAAEITTTTSTTSTTTSTTPEPPSTTTEIPHYKIRSQVTLYTGSDQTGKLFIKIHIIIILTD